MTEARDPLNRWTYYTYDTGYRPARITYPEGNYVEYTYDSRGNITAKTMAPKPGVGGGVLVERAGYDATCADVIICNRPRWMEDARLGRTDFEYSPSAQTTLPPFGNSEVWTVRRGTGKPVTVTSPAVGGVRPQIRTVYTSGMPVRISSCLTQASCVGTADEVVTTYEWNNSEGSYRHLYGKTVTAQGQTQRSCYSYDVHGRQVSETPPRAGLTSCPTLSFNPPAVTATMPSPGFPAVAPTFPDGSTGSGGGPVDPVDPRCGYGGVVCQ